MNPSNQLRYSGDAFCHGEQPTDVTAGDFWQWAFSDLLDNTVRGVLAEFLVGKALGCTGAYRVNWGASDLTTPAGVRVEVKSAAYRQSWTQKKPSTIRFSIRPAHGWNPETLETTPDQRRHADVYVFCLLENSEPGPRDPLDLSRWRFFVLSARVLNHSCPAQKSIGLAPLKLLGPVECGFGELSNVIAEMPFSNPSSPPLA